uniref:Uncharacterized protein n=1 Tax=Cacopsylla melanoneura TaxID=428564 RepID=A0A8D8ZJ39_9HEMI
MILSLFKWRLCMKLMKGSESRYLTITINGMNHPIQMSTINKSNNGIQQPSATNFTKWKSAYRALDSPSRDVRQKKLCLIRVVLAASLCPINSYKFLPVYLLPALSMGLDKYPNH